MLRCFPDLFLEGSPDSQDIEVLVLMLLARARALMLKEMRPELSGVLEENIIQLVGQGYRKREIAEILALREETLNAHIFSIFRTLGVSDLLELTLYAMIHRLPAGAGGSFRNPQTRRFEQLLITQARPAV